MLKSYVRRRSELAKTKAVDVNFFVPDYIYGDYSSETGDGVIVFEDYREVRQNLNQGRSSMGCTHFDQDRTEHCHEDISITLPG